MRLLIVFVTPRFIMLKNYSFKKKLICLLLTLGTLNATGRINQQSCCVVKNIRVYEDATQQSGTLGNNTMDFFFFFFS